VVKQKLNRDEVEELVAHVVAGSRPTMRVAIGDSTPRQYDRADAMAGGIARATRAALLKVGLADEEATDAST
jgi:hypothetical protein